MLVATLTRLGSSFLRQRTRRDPRSRAFEHRGGHHRAAVGDTASPRRGLRGDRLKPLRKSNVEPISLVGDGGPRGQSKQQGGFTFRIQIDRFSANQASPRTRGHRP